MGKPHKPSFTAQIIKWLSILIGTMITLIQMALTFLKEPYMSKNTK